MRMSCNGCRVLRKGCSENCSIRPCLQWIKSPESQANATVFLAKFYGRAGLLNLINAGPDHLRPAIFRSLLFEACGRIVNPIYGSVGLFWSGSWQLCQNAVEAVLRGAPITQIASDSADETHNTPPLKAYDIRHVSKDENSSVSTDLHRVKTRCRFKRSAAKAANKGTTTTKVVCVDESGHEEVNRSTSHESSLSHQSELFPEGDSSEVAAGAEALVMFRAEPVVKTDDDGGEDGEIELELSLGLGLRLGLTAGNEKPKEKGIDCDDGACEMELRLD